MNEKEILEQESLRGLERLSVVIEDLAPELEEGGLTKSKLKAQVKLGLDQAGIEVLPEEDVIDYRAPYLYINVNGMKACLGLYAYATRVALKQPVVLPRSPFAEVYMATWEIGGVGTVGVNHLPAILESVRSQIDKFCRDYLAANPVAHFDSKSHHHSHIPGTGLLS